MVTYPKHKTKFAQLLPESIWLEAEDFEEAVKISKRVTDEAHQWQMYLNSLALIGFERWVKQRYPDLSVNLDSCSLFESVNITEAVCNLKVGEFKVCLLVVEELGDKVSVPKVVVDLPELVAHFYVVVEVLEEEERVILGGFLRYDELVNYRSSVNLEASGDERYQLPLSSFDSEMNHLLFYSRYLAPSAIILPVIQEGEVKRDIADKLVGATGESLGKLSRWLDNIFDAGWQTLDQVLAAGQMELAFSVRSVMRTRHNIREKPTGGVERVKLLSSGIEKDGETLALLVGLIPTETPEMNISVEVYPTGGKTELPEAMQLMLLDEDGVTVMQAQARSSENIQFGFSGETGDAFSVQIVLGDLSFKEDFVI